MDYGMGVRLTGLAAAVEEAARWVYCPGFTVCLLVCLSACLSAGTVSRQLIKESAALL